MNIQNYQLFRALTGSVPWPIHTFFSPFSGGWLEEFPVRVGEGREGPRCEEDGAGGMQHWAGAHASDLQQPTAQGLGHLGELQRRPRSGMCDLGWMMLRHASKDYVDFRSISHITYLYIYNYNSLSIIICARNVVQYQYIYIFIYI